MTTVIINRVNPEETVNATGGAAPDGIITLSGKVEWLHQKAQIETAVRNITGVRDIRNCIEVVPRSSAREIQQRIVEALHRHTDADARRISVSLTGHVVALTGNVASSLEREIAELAAAAAPGITRVENRLHVTGI